MKRIDLTMPLTVGLHEPDIGAGRVPKNALEDYDDYLLEDADGYQLISND